MIIFIFSWIMSGLNAYFIATHMQKSEDGNIKNNNWLGALFCMLFGPISLFFSLVILMEDYKKS